MKKIIFGLLTVLLLTTTVEAGEYKDLPADILSDTDTHGRKHLRLMNIPSDEEASEKITKKTDFCYHKYCLVNISEEETECKIFRPPMLPKDDTPCLKWVKGYDDNGRLNVYMSYSIDHETKEIHLKHLVQWHENGQISHICYYDNAHCQSFNAAGELIRDCSETVAYSSCSEYDSEKREWTEYRISWIS